MIFLQKSTKQLLSIDILAKKPGWGWGPFNQDFSFSEFAELGVKSRRMSTYTKSAVSSAESADAKLLGLK